MWKREQRKSDTKKCAARHTFSVHEIVFGGIDICSSERMMGKNTGWVGAAMCAGLWDADHLTGTVSGDSANTGGGTRREYGRCLWPPVARLKEIGCW